MVTGFLGAKGAGIKENEAVNKGSMQSRDNQDLQCTELEGEGECQKREGSH